MAFLLARISNSAKVIRVIRLTLSDSDREAISEALDDPAFDERSKRKLMAIRMHDANVPHGTIANILNISSDTVTNYCKLFAGGGINALLENRYFIPTSKVEAYLDAIKESLVKEPVSTAKQGAARIQEITGFELSEDQARRIMKRLGLAYRQSAAIPGGADPQLQLDFLRDELLPKLDEARQGNRRVFFVDAAHFVLGAFLGMIWCLQRLFVKSGSGRHRYSVLGAIETRDHDFVSIRTEGSVNSQTLCALLEALHERYPSEPITLVLDNARYQRNAVVMNRAITLGIELLFLPAYSPNLNLIERVWRLVRSKTLRNRYFPDFSTFRSAIDGFLDSLSKENRLLLKTLITENFQTFSFPKN